MTHRFAIAAAVLAAALSSAAAAAAAPAPNPSVVTQDPAAAPAGTYKADPNHTAVVARVPHGGGMSISVFRFGDTEATLGWNPADPSRSTLTARVGVASIATPVKGFPEELAGEMFLNAGRYPQATFTSTSVQRTGPLSADIAGTLNFRGAAHPLVLKATMVGAGKNREGKAALGFTATGKMKPAEYGLMLGPPTMEIELVIDSELVQ